MTTMTSDEIQWATKIGFRVLANTDQETKLVAFIEEPETVDRDGWIVGAGGRTVELTVRRGALDAWSTDLYDAEFEGGGCLLRCFAGDARLVWDYALETLRGAR